MGNSTTAAHAATTPTEGASRVPTTEQFLAHIVKSSEAEREALREQNWDLTTINHLAHQELQQIHDTLASVEELARNAPEGQVTGEYVAGLLESLRCKARDALGAME